MPEYIEREKALSAQNKSMNLNEMRERLKRIPAADVREVVLCRDCKYYSTTGCADGFGWCEDSVVNTGVWDNFFCGRADMRGETDG